MESGLPARKKTKIETLDKFIASSPKSVGDTLAVCDVNRSNDPKTAIAFNWKKIKAVNLDLDYCSRFYARSEADQIFQELEKDIEYFTGKLAKVFVYGKWHDVPRKQVTFGEPGLSYKFSGITAPSQPWPQVLLKLKEKVSKVSENDYNFVLVNRYSSGNDYMAEHRDNEKELDPLTPIASMSFGQARDFIFTHGNAKKKEKSSKDSKVPPVKLVLEHGSLLLMNHPTNVYWYHSLPRRKTAPGVRINLTFRKLIKNNCSS